MKRWLVKQQLEHSNPVQTTQANPEELKIKQGFEWVCSKRKKKIEIERDEFDELQMNRGVGFINTEA